MAPECDKAESEEALKRAKSNVEKYFAVVGILEMWQESLQVMEHYVPRYFNGARHAYNQHMREKPKNKNIFKPKVSKEIKRQIAVNQTAELEFYEFCKQRFYKQYLSIK